MIRQYIYAICQAFLNGNLEPIKQATLQNTSMTTYIKMGHNINELSQCYLVLAEYQCMILQDSNSLIPSMVYNLYECEFKNLEQDKVIIFNGMEEIIIKFPIQNGRDRFIKQVELSKSNHYLHLKKIIKQYQVIKQEGN